MENGLGRVDVSEKAMKNEIMESKVEEKVKVGYHESKASMGDEDFKDSIAAEVPTILSEDMVTSSANDVDKAGILNRSMVGHKKADSGTDFEKFEEAVDFPIEVENQIEKLHSIEDTKEVFAVAEPIEKPTVDEVSIGEGVMKKNEEKELDRVENDLIAHKKTDSGIDSEKFEEAVDVPVDSDKKEEQLADIDDTSEVPVGVEPVDKPTVTEITNGEGVLEKMEENEPNRVSNDDVAVSKQADEEIKTSDISSAANDKEIIEEEKVRELDIGAVLDKEIQEDAIVEKHENGVSDDVGLERTLAHEAADDGLANVEKITVAEEPKTVPSLPLVNCDSPQAVEIVKSLDEDETVEEVNETSSSLDNGHEDKKSFENNGDAASEIRLNSVEEVNPSSVTVKSEFKDEKVEKEIAGRPKTLHENGTDKEIKGAAYLAEDNRVENIEKRNRDLAPANLDDFVTNGKTESCVVKKEETHDVKRSPISENVVVERGEKVQENASDKDVKGAKVSQIEAADKSLKSPNIDTNKDETARIKVEAKQNTQGTNGNSTTLPARPAGLGRTAPLLETAPRVMQQNRVNGTSPQTQSQIVDDVANGETEENDETREKLQMIRVKFLRLAHRLGQTPHNVVVAQVLYRLGLAEQLRGRNGGRVAGFSFDRASAMAEQLEAAGQEPLDFSCTIMVLGKSGVGKSSTINSIFDEVKFSTDAFQLDTKKVQDVVGTVQGIKVRVIDTPGLLPSWSDQRQNEKILLSVKRFIKKTPPDIVLYLDRLDMQTRDLGDMPLLRTITDIFGPSIWFNAIVVLTHAASAPPEGANGTATSYEMFVTNRSHVVQQAIRQAAGDMRLMNPVSLVENHSACRKNRAGQRVLPNGQVWKPHLLLLSFASKILAEANTLLKLQDSPPGRPFATRTRAPPLPYLLSSLLQSRPQLKLPEDQLGDDEALGEDIDESSDSDDDSEYDDLPPFKRLTKEQLGKLTKNQKKAYYDELEYREKLFMKKQLKEEKKRRKMMKKMAKEMPSDYNENIEESGGAASVPVPMPDLALPASFDSDNPTHRYRYLDSPNSWVVRPVLDTHGWDHDIGYEGVNVEKLFVVKEKIPVSFSGQITKDKKDANMQMEMGSSIKHGEGKATTLGLDMQSLGKDMAYTLRTETKFSNYKKNKATAGFSVTKLGDTVSAGVKIEDQFIVNKRLRLVASGGAMTGRGDMAYGGSFEATLRDKDHPLGRSLLTLGLSVMDWHGDLAIGGNIQSQIPVGRSSNLIARANLNNKGSGQVSIRLNSSEQLQIVLVALVPLIRKLVGHVQLSQFGQ